MKRGRANFLANKTDYKILHMLFILTNTIQASTDFERDLNNFVTKTVNKTEEVFVKKMVLNQTDPPFCVT